MHAKLSLFAVAALGAVVLLAAPSASQPEPETYEIDPVHSNVLFRINHLGVSNFYGRSNEVKGTFTVAEGGTGSVSVTIPVATVDTGFAKCDDHLRSTDSAEEFPEITFESDSVKHLGGSK